VWKRLRAADLPRTQHALALRLLHGSLYVGAFLCHIQVLPPEAEHVAPTHHALRRRSLILGRCSSVILVLELALDYLGLGATSGALNPLMSL
jgi:hypothetical protein